MSGRERFRVLVLGRLCLLRAISSDHPCTFTQTAESAGDFA